MKADKVGVTIHRRLGKPVVGDAKREHGADPMVEPPSHGHPLVNDHPMGLILSSSLPKLVLNLPTRTPIYADPLPLPVDDAKVETGLPATICSLVDQPLTAPATARWLTH